MFSRLLLKLFLLVLLLKTYMRAADASSLPCNLRRFGKNNFVCVCNATYCDTIEPLEQPSERLTYIHFTSRKDGLPFSRTTGQFQQQSHLTSSDLHFVVDRTQRFQKIFGFGGAFTDSAGINILSLSQGAQENLLRSYFSKDGIEVNFGRVPMGGSDFSTRPYTLDDIPGDKNLVHFNLTDEDYKYKIPMIKRAMGMNERTIHLIASPWSAPPWMKTNNKITGFGFLKKEYYDTWANYYIKFLEAYQTAGLMFWGMTTGNEPLDGFIPFIVRFNSMGWYPWDQRQWIGDHLGPKIRSSKFNSTNIIAFDDQRLLLPKWLDMIMSYKNAANYIDGFGIHWYTDFITSVKRIDKVHQQYPDKFILNTEACQGDKPWEKNVDLGSWKRGERYIDDITEDLSNWMSGWLEWNFALDMKGSPNWAHNFVDSPIIVNKEMDEFYKQPMFYAIGHFSKFIREGARRIGLHASSNKLKILAVENKDNSIVLVVQNSEKKPMKVTLEDPALGKAALILDPFSFNTFIYWPGKE